MAIEFSRRSLLRGMGAAAVAIPAGTWLAGCGSDDDSGDLLEEAISRGFLRVAIANEPPYTQVDADGTVTGCEPDVCRAVCKRLGIDDIQGIVTPYNGMIPGLQAGRWDAITAGLFMKESRCAEVLYSDPVIVSTESFGVVTGNPKGIHTIQDVIDNPDLKIEVLPGAFEEGILKEAGVPDSQMIKINDNRSGIEAVVAGRADAFLLPTLSLRALAEGQEGFEVTDPIPDAPKTGSGAAFRKSDDAFVKRYNEELDKLKQTDEFAEILTKWDFDPTVVEGVTAEELCQTPG